VFQRQIAIGIEPADGLSTPIPNFDAFDIKHTRHWKGDSGFGETRSVVHTLNQEYSWDRHQSCSCRWSSNKGSSVTLDRISNPPPTIQDSLYESILASMVKE